ncbi:MAG: hypothetical protein ACXAEX_11665 [Promethearchaeota archaeon]|jgi:hypothetical protein
MNGLNHKKIILTIFSVFLIFFGIIHLSSFSSATINPQEIDMPVEFRMQESTSLSGEFNDTSSIEIDLFTTESNITRLEMIVRDLRHRVNETKVIEENGGQYETISSTQNEALAVQINITGPTTIYGVEIYGHATGAVWGDAYVQIKEYNYNTNYPTFITCGPQATLNISTTLGWYIQKFPEPIYLEEGYYYLVMRDPNSEATEGYRWYYNSVDPQYPNLYSAIYESGAWDDLSISHVFQHKLIQRVYKPVKPSAIDLKVEVDSVFYNVSDGATFNSGSVSLENMSIQLNTDLFQIPLYHNSSSSLLFSYEYNLSLTTNFYSEGTLTIKENSYNTWNITPNISRHGYNQTIRFKCPDDWNDMVIYKNEVDITSELLIEQDYFYILNATITDDSDWLIMARSYLYDYEIDCLSDQIVQGEILTVSVLIPQEDGIVTLKIFNSHGIEIHNETKIVNSNSMTFNYTIPSNSPDGIYYAYVFWQNNIDAGVQNHAFYVAHNEIWFQNLFFILLISVILGAAGVVSSYKILKRKRNRTYATVPLPRNEATASKKLYETIIHNKFIDIFNLKAIIISDKLSGLYIFEKSFQGTEFDPLLVSGFIRAIKSFGQEVVNINTGNQILNIEYQGLNIYMMEVNSFSFILVMGMKPSNEFLLAIDNLVEEIDYKYGDKIMDFQGDVSAFDGIMDLVEKDIEVNLLYPYKFNSNLNYNFNPEEKNILYKTYDIMKQNGHDYFYLFSILSKTNMDLKTAEIILKFIRLNVFIPFT